MTTLIETKNLSRRYRTTQALDSVNLQIKQGQIVGLLGPNGAGKTTLLKILLGLSPFEGQVSVLGLNPQRHRAQLMQRMCFIADVATLPRWIKVSQALDFIEGVHPKFCRDKAMELLKKTDILLEHTVKSLSKGMVTQLHLALVMAIDVEILVLDEPTLGLDILYRKQFYRSLLNDYFNEKRTIIITTHQVEEVESILTDLIMIDHGKILLNQPMADLNKQYTLVNAKPEQAAELTALNPIDQHSKLGMTQYLFEGADQKALAKLGELSIPSVSDIFVAKVTGAKK